MRETNGSNFAKIFRSELLCRPFTFCFAGKTNKHADFVAAPKVFVYTVIFVFSPARILDQADGTFQQDIQSIFVRLNSMEYKSYFGISLKYLTSCVTASNIIFDVFDGIEFNFILDKMVIFNRSQFLVTSSKIS